MGIAVALLPSNQDRHTSPFRPDYNEAGGQAFLAPLIAEACGKLGINAKVIVPTLESADNPPGSLAGLRAQQKAGNAWLDAQSETMRCLVNFHTDSGTRSHTFGIYGTQNLDSRRLAEAIAPRVFRALGTAEFRSFSQLGDMNYSTYLFATMARYPACLIEECAHTVQRDIDALYAHPHQVAEAFAAGIAAYAGIEPADDWQAKYEALAAKVRAAVAALS